MPRFTPGASVASWVKLRPLSGRFSICFSSMSVEISEVDFSMSGAAAVTVSSSETPPSCILKSMRATWLTASVMFVACGLNPLRSICTLYGPTGSAVSVYAPFSLLTSTRCALVLVFVAVTVAPGRTAPVLSVTMPSMRAVAVWENAGHVTKAMTTRTRNDFARNEIMSPPWLADGSISLPYRPGGAGVRRERHAAEDDGRRAEVVCHDHALAGVGALEGQHRRRRVEQLEVALRRRGGSFSPRDPLAIVRQQRFGIVRLAGHVRGGAAGRVVLPRFS